MIHGRCDRALCIQFAHTAHCRYLIQLFGAYWHVVLGKVPHFNAKDNAYAVARILLSPSNNREDQLGLECSNVLAATLAISS